MFISKMTMFLYLISKDIYKCTTLKLYLYIFELFICTFEIFVKRFIHVYAKALYKYCLLLLLYYHIDTTMDISLCCIEIVTSVCTRFVDITWYQYLSTSVANIISSAGQKLLWSLSKTLMWWMISVYICGHLPNCDCHIGMTVLFAAGWQRRHTFHQVDQAAKEEYGSTTPCVV